MEADKEAIRSALTKAPNQRVLILGYRRQFKTSICNEVMADLYPQYFHLFATNGHGHMCNNGVFVKLEIYRKLILKQQYLDGLPIFVDDWICNGPEFFKSRVFAKRTAPMLVAYFHRYFYGQKHIPGDEDASAPPLAVSPETEALFDTVITLTMNSQIAAAVTDNMRSTMLREPNHGWKVGPSVI